MTIDDFHMTSERIPYSQTLVSLYAEISTLNVQALSSEPH